MVKSPISVEPCSSAFDNPNLVFILFHNRPLWDQSKVRVGKISHFRWKPEPFFIAWYSVVQYLPIDFRCVHLLKYRTINLIGRKNRSFIVTTGIEGTWIILLGLKLWIAIKGLLTIEVKQWISAIHILLIKVYRPESQLFRHLSTFCRM